MGRAVVAEINREPIPELLKLSIRSASSLLMSS